MENICLYLFFREFEFLGQEKMWGFGGKYYWGRRERGGKIEGIVVVFGWLSSQERHLKNYVQLYSCLGWNSLICHPEFLNS